MRDPRTLIDVSGGGYAPVEVTACRDIKFSGSCVVIKSHPGQCGR